MPARKSCILDDFDASLGIKVLRLKFFCRYIIIYYINMEFKTDMLKKERRDTVLLAFMAAITIVFLLYVLIPSSAEKENGGNTTLPMEEIDKEDNDMPIKTTLPEDPTEESILNDLNKKIENELSTIYESIIKSGHPFKEYNVEKLKKLPGEFKSPVVDKLFKFSFGDLKDIPLLEFPKHYSSSLKFNIFLSLFLVKIQEEEIETKFEELPQSRFEKKVRFDCCRLVNHEIEKDCQLIPVLFYFKLLVDRLNLYPREDNTSFFIEKLKGLRDLSPSKYIVKIREILSFSKRAERYRLEWIEYDSIGPNDKKAYTNLELGKIHFLGQEYLLFPDSGKSRNNRWIRDLCGADSGNIELVLLNIQNEDPSKPLRYIDKIVYTPLHPQFVVLLKEYSPISSNGFLDNIIKERISDFHKNFRVVRFPRNAADSKNQSFRTELEKFGNFLKRNKRAIE